MTPEAIENHLNDLTEWMRDSIVRKYGRDNCVLSTRIAGAYLAKHGIVAVPVVTQCMAFNEAYHDHVFGKEETMTEDELTALAGKAHCVAATEAQPQGAKGLHGHMIAIVNGEYLLDMSADQFARPDKGIEVSAFWTRIPTVGRKAFIRGRNPFILSSNNADGSKTWLAYHLQPQRKDYIGSADWTADIHMDIT